MQPRKARALQKTAACTGASKARHATAAASRLAPATARGLGSIAACRQSHQPPRMLTDLTRPREHSTSGTKPAVLAPIST